MERLDDQTKTRFILQRKELLEQPDGTLCQYPCYRHLSKYRYPRRCALGSENRATLENRAALSFGSYVVRIIRRSALRAENEPLDSSSKTNFAPLRPKEPTE